MTAQQIAKMLKLARVPFSRVVIVTFPNPRVDIAVPATHFPIVAAVVQQVKALTDDVNVRITTRRECPYDQHVLFKVRGDNKCNYGGVADTLHPVEQRRLRRAIQLRANTNIVIDYALVAS
jgi:hypothetical protein